MSAFKRFASAEEAEAFAAEKGGEVRHIPARGGRTYEVPDEGAIEAAVKEDEMLSQWAKEIGENWSSPSLGNAVVGIADFGQVSESDWASYLRPSRLQFWREHRSRFPAWAARCRSLVQGHQRTKTGPETPEAWEVMWEPEDNTDYSSSDWYGLH